MTDRLFDTSAFIDRGAVFDGPYRYHLWRQWAPGRKTALWVMLNPSTADADVLDPTLRRCLAFSKGWGCSRFEVVNIFAWKSTDPKALYGLPDPIGPQNDAVILSRALVADIVVVGWGLHGRYSRRASEVMKLLAAAKVGVQCLGTTKDGYPSHPLYLPYATPLEAYSI